MWNKSRNFAIKIKITGQNEQTRRNETNNMVRENIHRAHDHHVSYKHLTLQTKRIV